MILATPPFLEKSPNKLQNQYEQICHLLAASIVQTADVLLPLHADCSVFNGKDPGITLWVYKVCSQQTFKTLASKYH